MQNYRLLKPGEMIKRGGEFEDYGGRWDVTAKEGSFVPENGVKYRRAWLPPDSFDLDFTGYGWRMRDTDKGPFLFECSEEWGMAGEPVPLTRENLERARTEARQWLELLENLTPID